MSSLVKIGLALTLLSFTAYVFHVEPNASAEPIGAVQRATYRLATTCERNPDECQFVADTANRAYRLGAIGWGLVSGQGRLVYVPHEGTKHNLHDGGGRTGWGAGGYRGFGSSYGTGADGDGSGGNLSITGLINSEDAYQCP